MKRLDGTVALVTGASSGFGWAIARAIAAQGAATALVARTNERLEALAAEIEADGGRALACPADVGSEAEILAAVERTLTTLGPVDLLVNNAGTNIAARRIAETDSGAWRELLEVNLTSAYLFTKGLAAGDDRASTGDRGQHRLEGQPHTRASSPAWPTAPRSGAWRRSRQ